MTLLDRSNTLVVVPAYNEQDSIAQVIEEIKATGFHFVVIDDGSTDETRTRSIAAGARTITLPFNVGVGGAVRCGFRFALNNGFESVVQCDADGQHPPIEIQKLLEKTNFGNYQMVLGNRFANAKRSDLAKSKRAAINLFRFLIFRKSGIEISDPTCGLRLIRTPLLGYLAEKMPPNYLGDTFETVYVAAMRNYPLGEVNVLIRERTFGSSTASTLKASANVVKTSVKAWLSFHFEIPYFTKQSV
jgi:glycosyltransferase involved in cell wall biosynthesis